jgi:hypothetical protein
MTMKLNPVLLHLRKRIINSKGLNIIICGEPGGGKSRRGLRLCEIFDFNGFNRDKIVYNAEAFIEFLNGKAVKGDAVMWDENIGSEATSWYTDTNKAVKRSMNIMRKKGITFVQCLPSLLDLQSGCRRLFHIYVEPMDFFPLDDGYTCKVMRMQHNPQNKITYFKYFRVRDPHNKHIKKVLHRLFIHTPRNEELTQKYEDESEKEKDAVHADNLGIIRKEQKDKQRDWRASADIEEHILTIINNPKQFKKGKRWDPGKIQILCNVGGPLSYRIKKAVEMRLKSNKTVI